jgi:hypothetical protein
MLARLLEVRRGKVLDLEFTALPEQMIENSQVISMLFSQVVKSKQNRNSTPLSLVLGHRWLVEDRTQPRGRC